MEAVSITHEVVIVILCQGAVNIVEWLTCVDDIAVGVFLSMTMPFFFFSSRRRHTRLQGDWSSDVCSSDLRPHIRRLIWRFTPDLQVAVTQVIAGDADAVEVLGPPDNVKRAQAAPNLTLYPYHGGLYGFLAFNLSTNGDTAKPHPLFGDRQLRRALAMAVDREALRQSVWGDLAQVPPGPLARIWSIWDPETRNLPYDSAQAARLLTRLGWRDSNGDGIRDRDGH